MCSDAAHLTQSNKKTILGNFLKWVFFIVIEFGQKFLFTMSAS